MPIFGLVNTTKGSYMQEYVIFFFFNDGYMNDSEGGWF